MDLDRFTARALVDAGYMQLNDYIEQFGEVDQFEKNTDRSVQILQVGNHRTRQWGVASSPGELRPWRHRRSRTATKPSAA